MLLIFKNKKGAKVAVKSIKKGKQRNQKGTFCLIINHIFVRDEIITLPKKQDSDKFWLTSKGKRL